MTGRGRGWWFTSVDVFDEASTEKGRENVTIDTTTTMTMTLWLQSYELPLHVVSYPLFLFYFGPNFGFFRSVLIRLVVSQYFVTD